MSIFQLGDAPSTYQEAFTRHPLPEKMTRNKRTVLRLKELAHRRASVVEPPKPMLGWTTPNYGLIRDENKPSFDVYLKEPKEITGRLPKPNLQVQDVAMDELAAEHEEVIKTRPRVQCCPNQIAADDGNEEQRKMHAYHTYYREHRAGHTAGNSVFSPDLDITIPKDSFIEPKFEAPVEIFPRIKPKLKRCLARIDADKERWLEFSNSDYNKKEVRNQEEREPTLNDEWLKDLEQLHTHNISRTKYKNYSLGYTGHISSTSLPVKKERHMTLDPTLSFYEACDSRKDSHTLHVEPEIRKKYDDLPLDKLRIIYGVTYIPTCAHYSPDINNVPFKEFRREL